MVFVFGIDVPLVELIFILTLILALLFGILVYLLINQINLHKMLQTVLRKEDIELKGLKEIGDEEKSELRMLRGLKAELDKLLYGEAYFKKMTHALNPKKSKVKLTEKERAKIADEFWKRLGELSKKRRSNEIFPMLEKRKNELDKQLQKIVDERKKVDDFLHETKR
ncbi:MAG: hypothetical protein ABIA37_01855 [Candidatus Woesearchaeota archaeon]